MKDVSDTALALNGWCIRREVYGGMFTLWLRGERFARAHGPLPMLKRTLEKVLNERTGQ